MEWRLIEKKSLILQSGWRRSIYYILETKHYVYLMVGNLRNFQPSRESIVVLTHIAWAAIVISAHRLSQGLLSRCDIAAHASCKENH